MAFVHSQPSAAVGLHRKPLWRRIKEGPVFFLVPLFAMLLLFYLWPVLDVIRLSFTNSKIGSAEYTYTLDSYVQVLTDPSFVPTLGITFVFVVLSVVFQTGLGFGIALLVCSAERRNTRGTLFVRTVALITWAIPGVVIGIIWKMLFDESQAGILNYFIQLLGMKSIAFLSNQDLAKYSISLANIWRGTAPTMILMYAGLKTVPTDMLEAAEVDGAVAWQRLIHIIVPSVRPVILTNLLLNTINTFNTFDMIMSLTGGGPGRSTEVLVLNAYNRIFSQLQLGRGAVVAVILLLINMTMSFVYIRLGTQKEDLE